MSAASLLEGLSPAQVEAVTTTAGPLAIVAGPGSGKTRTLTRRVAYRCVSGAADASHTLVLTFSRRAAVELLGRLARLGLPTGARSCGVVAGTFHAVAWAEVSRHRAERHLAPLAILGRPARLIRPALASVTGREPSAREVDAKVTEFARVRAQGLTPDDAVWVAYEQAKRSRGVADLDDLMALCLRILTEDPAAGEAARWRHRHVFVDEYQDLNPAHCRLLQAWVAGRPDVCVVGDPSQAIYGFNGSVPDIFDRLDADWPGGHVVTLDDNFRSSPEIVSFAGALGAQAIGHRPPGPVP
ncbi:MAG: UvrD-helicase domain-containing protein, partial [Acidimicrobiales bacterium]